MKIHKVLAFEKNFFQKHSFEIYKGEIFLFPNAWKQTNDLLCELEFQLINELGMKFFSAEFILSQDRHFHKISLVREKLYNSKNWFNLTKSFLFELGFLHNEWIFDYPRVRAIVTEMNRSPLAKSAYYIHRDTWYGNSESQINIWIPLCDITKQNGFAFYLNYFSKPIPNDSNQFKYEDWKSLGSYQSNNLNKIFPKSKISLSNEEATYFECPKGGILVFSASHLHATLPNLTDQTRYSLDLRVVNLRHHFFKIGAPNVDNESIGNNLADMFKLVT